jgi:hypothetical protein
LEILTGGGGSDIEGFQELVVGAKEGLTQLLN